MDVILWLSSYHRRVEEPRSPKVFSSPSIFKVFCGIKLKTFRYIFQNIQHAAAVLLEQVEQPARRARWHISGMYSQLLLYRTGWVGLRFRVRYIRNLVYPNIRLCTKHTVSRCCAGLKFSVRYSRDRYNRESGIRAIDCICTAFR